MSLLDEINNYIYFVSNQFYILSIYEFWLLNLIFVIIVLDFAYEVVLINLHICFKLIDNKFCRIRTLNMKDNTIGNLVRSY